MQAIQCQVEKVREQPVVKSVLEEVGKLVATAEEKAVAVGKHPLFLAARETLQKQVEEARMKLEELIAASSQLLKQLQEKTVTAGAGLKEKVEDLTKACAEQADRYATLVHDSYTQHLPDHRRQQVDAAAARMRAAVHQVSCALTAAYHQLAAEGQKQLEATRSWMELHVAPRITSAAQAAHHQAEQHLPEAYTTLQDGYHGYRKGALGLQSFLIVVFKAFLLLAEALVCKAQVFAARFAGDARGGKESSEVKQEGEVKEAAPPVAMEPEVAPAAEEKKEEVVVAVQGEEAGEAAAEERKEEKEEEAVVAVQKEEVQKEEKEEEAVVAVQKEEKEEESVAEKKEEKEEVALPPKNDENKALKSSARQSKSSKKKGHRRGDSATTAAPAANGTLPKEKKREECDSEGSGSMPKTPKTATSS